MTDKQTNWVEKMIEREALPKGAREETTEVFIEKWGIPRSTYFYEKSKKETQDKILTLSLLNARKYAPDVLDKLGQRAIDDNKATELYIKFILQLVEKIGLDFKVIDEETKQKTQKAIKEVIGSRNTGRGEDTGN